MGIATGGQELVRRNLLAYQRSEEQAADHAAMRYLSATGQSPKGMLDTFARFADFGPVPLPRGRPLSRQPSAADASASASSNGWRSRARISPPRTRPALQARHDLMRAKLFGFVERADTVLRRYPPSNTSAPARYARAVLAYKSGRLSEALAAIDGLLAEQPDNPYFHELKGQALLESGRAREAVGPLRRAVALAPNGVPIRAMLGQALVASGDGPTRRSASSRTRRPASPNPPRPSGISPWPTAARAISARRSSPPRRASSTPATSRTPRPRRAAPWPSCRPARRAISRPKTS